MLCCALINVVFYVKELHSLEDDYDENGILPELMNENSDSKAIRNANVSDQATAQQTVMSAWQ